MNEDLERKLFDLMNEYKKPVSGFWDRWRYGLLGLAAASLFAVGVIVGPRIFTQTPTLTTYLPSPSPTLEAVVMETPTLIPTYAIPTNTPTLAPITTPKPANMPTYTPTPKPTSTPMPILNLTNHIAFASVPNIPCPRGPGIYIMNADGSNPTQLTHKNPECEDLYYEDLSPDGSPDGHRIVFESTRDGDHDIFVMNADGSNQTRLTNNDGYDGEPAWSPDGSRIAFVSYQGRGYSDIYVMDANGSNRIQLTNEGLSNSSPTWSPDGQKIAFVSDHLGNEIYVMGADGGNMTKLTNYTLYIAGDLAWSPDGRRIAFRAAYIGWDEIYTINSDGSGLTRLTDNNVVDSHPTWSPDGKRIAFVSNYSNIYVMDADGGNERLIYNGGYDPDWSPR